MKNGTLGLFFINLEIFITRILNKYQKKLFLFIHSGSKSMNSGTQQENQLNKQQSVFYSEYPATQFSLTSDQCMIIQQYLPKGYSLNQKKISKRGMAHSNKNGDHENLIRAQSLAISNTEEDQARQKRGRIKKNERMNEEELTKGNRKVQKCGAGDEMLQCTEILNQLKSHSLALPFLQPVDPKKAGASNYFDFIKEPMDLSTVEKNLKKGLYENSSQFHADIEKIWKNSYEYNEKTSDIYKNTVKMDKLHKKLYDSRPKKPNKLMKSKSKSQVKDPKNQEKQEEREGSKREFFDGEYEEEVPFLFQQ